VLIIGSAACRAEPLVVLQRQGYHCAEIDNPYSAMAELCRRPLAYRAVIVSLQSIFREELGLISTLKRRFGHLEIWLSQTDGRQASLVEAMRLGADGLLADDGLHRLAPSSRSAPGAPQPPAIPHEEDATRPGPQAMAEESELPPAHDADSGEGSDESSIGEPVLTADELRALLQDAPTDSIER
jgi:hypothetical protein